MTRKLQRITTLLLIDDDPSMVCLLAKVLQRAVGDRLFVHSFTLSPFFPLFPPS